MSGEQDKEGLGEIQKVSSPFSPETNRERLEYTLEGYAQDGYLNEASGANARLGIKKIVLFLLCLLVCGVGGYIFIENEFGDDEDQARQRSASEIDGRQNLPAPRPAVNPMTMLKPTTPKVKLETDPLLLAAEARGMIQEERYQEAEFVLQDVERLTPQVGLELRALLCERQGKWRKAIIHLKNLHALANSGEREDLESRIVLLENYLEIEPTDFGKEIVSNQAQTKPNTTAKDLSPAPTASSQQGSSAPSPPSPPRSTIPTLAMQPPAAETPQDNKSQTTAANNGPRKADSSEHPKVDPTSTTAAATDVPEPETTTPEKAASHLLVTHTRMENPGAEGPHREIWLISLHLQGEGGPIEPGLVEIRPSCFDYDTLTGTIVPTQASCPVLPPDIQQDPNLAVLHFGYFLHNDFANRRFHGFRAEVLYNGEYQTSVADVRKPEGGMAVAKLNSLPSPPAESSSTEPASNPPSDKREVATKASAPESQAPSNSNSPATNVHEEEPTPPGYPLSTRIDRNIARIAGSSKQDIEKNDAPDVPPPSPAVSPPHPPNSPHTPHQDAPFIAALPKPLQPQFRPRIRSTAPTAPNPFAPPSTALLPSETTEKPVNPPRPVSSNPPRLPNSPGPAETAQVPPLSTNLDDIPLYKPPDQQANKSSTDSFPRQETSTPTQSSPTEGKESVPVPMAKTVVVKPVSTDTVEEEKDVSFTANVPPESNPSGEHFAPPPSAPKELPPIVSMEELRNGIARRPQDIPKSAPERSNLTTGAEEKRSNRTFIKEGPESEPLVAPPARQRPTDLPVRPGSTRDLPPSLGEDRRNLPLPPRSTPSRQMASIPMGDATLFFVSGRSVTLPVSGPFDEIVQIELLFQRDPKEDLDLARVRATVDFFEGQPSTGRVMKSPVRATPATMDIVNRGGKERIRLRTEYRLPQGSRDKQKSQFGEAFDYHGYGIQVYYDGNLQTKAFRPTSLASRNDLSPQP